MEKPSLSDYEKLALVALLDAPQRVDPRKASPVWAALQSLEGKGFAALRLNRWNLTNAGRGAAYAVAAIDNATKES